MQQAGDPYVPLRVQTYRPAFFRTRRGVKVHPDLLDGQILAGVEQALREQFSFAARQFGQQVALSEVVAVMQSVTGVIAVDLDKLYRFDDTFIRIEDASAGGSASGGRQWNNGSGRVAHARSSPLHDLGCCHEL